MVLFSTVRSVGAFVPERVVTNHELSQMMDTTDTWIQERSGIQERRIASVDMGTSDLGLRAAQHALERAELKASELDLIIAATLSPDFYFPGIGVMIQHKLGTTTPAIDLRGQCSGFAWGVSTADAFIRSGQYRRVMVIGAEIHSRVIEFSDRGRHVSVLFGDGAGAMILEATQGERMPTPQNQVRGVIDHRIGSDGSGAEYLAMKRPGLRAGFELFMTGQEASDKDYLPYMEGRQVFKHAVTRMVETGKSLMTQHHISVDDLDLLVPHQANLRINQMVADTLGIPKEKTFNNIHKYGNTTAATIPLCLVDAQDQGLLKPGALVLTLAFGAGFTWGGNLLRW